MVGAELDLVAHQHHGQIHHNEFNGESVNYKFHINANCITDDVNDACFGFREAVDQFRVEEARKVAVEPFVVA